jgi:hypothetical protein
LGIGDSIDAESEKENENGEESCKSPSKNRKTVTVAMLDETQEELQYRQTHALSKSASW